MTCHKHDCCRLCGSSDTYDIADFGDTPLANAFTVTPSPENEEVYPLVVFMCGTCGSVQLRHTVSPEVLYRNYLYVSSTSPAFCRHFSAYAEESHSRFELKPTDLVCDIGSNDGVLLRPFKELGCRVLGVEPATQIAARANETGLETIPEFFSQSLATGIVTSHGACKLITANNVFAHIDNLHDIIGGVKTLLADDGVFIFENAYWLDTVTNLYFDQVYAEHLYYHSVRPLVRLFSLHGMKVFRVERQNIQGGTLRVFVQKENGPHTVDESVDSFLHQERNLYQFDTYLNFHLRLSGVKQTLRETLDKYKTIAAYGAPAKFTTFCYVMDVADRIKFVVDDSPIKQGLYTPGSHIPVVSKEQLHNEPTDACLVSAWNFADSIIKNNTYDGRWIVPLPQVREISS